MPELDYAVGDDGAVTFPASGHRYEVRPRPRGTPAVALFHGSTLLRLDRVDPDAARGLWFCFGCLRGGDVFDLALALFDPPSFAAAVDLVAAEVGLPRPGRRGRGGTGRGGPREGSVRVA